MPSPDPDPGPMTMSEDLMRVPAIIKTNANANNGYCSGCAVRDVQGCSEERCRFKVAGSGTGRDARFVDYILINPAKLEKYKIAKIAYDLDNEIEDETDGEPWDFR